MTSQDGAPPSAEGPGPGATRRSGGLLTRRDGGSRTRGRLVPGAVVVVAVLGLGSWFAVGRPDTQGVRSVAGAPHCPDTQPPLPAHRNGLELRIVPVLPLPIGPVGATLCDYPGAVAGGPHRPVQGSVLDAARTAEVAGWLDSGVRAVPPGEVPCTAGDGPRMVITFRYAEGPPVQVTVPRSGCRTASNGVRIEIARGDLLALMDRLIEHT